MVSHVLVPMDDSSMAEAALTFALETFPSATITVLHVVGGPSGQMGDAASLALADDVEATVDERTAPVFERARGLAADAGRDIETMAALGPPAKTIIDRSADFDLVVIGSHNSNGLASRLLLGNVAKRVTHNAPVPVTVVR